MEWRTVRTIGLMSSMSDSLLPRGNNAPVTTGYGFARPSKAQFYETECELVAQPNEDVGNKDQQQASQSYGKTPPLCNLYFIFVINVGLTLLLPLLFPGAFWNKPCHEALTFEDRAAKILAENPLIGLKFFSYIRQQQQQDQSNGGNQTGITILLYSYVLFTRMTSTTKTLRTNSSMVVWKPKSIFLVYGLERLVEPFGVLSYRVRQMAQISQMAIMSKVSRNIKYHRYTAKYLLVPPLFVPAVSQKVDKANGL